MKAMFAALAAVLSVALVSPVAAQPSTGAVPPDSAWVRYPAASEVAVENAAVIVVVQPQMRGDTAFVVVNNGPLPSPQARVRGGRLTLDGGLRSRFMECQSNGGVQVRGYGLVRRDQLPVIYVRTPDSLVFSAAGPVSVTSSPATSARLALSGCANGSFGAITEGLVLGLAGGSTAIVGPSGHARVSVAGDGQAMLGPVGRDLDVSIAGDGRVAVGTVNGPTRVAIQGDGDVNLGAGHTETLRVAIAGDGRVRFNGEADELSAAIVGDGLVQVLSVRGDVERRVAGSGAVRIGPFGASAPPAPAAAPRPTPAPVPAPAPAPSAAPATPVPPHPH